MISMMPKVGFSAKLTIPDPATLPPRMAEGAQSAADRLRTEYPHDTLLYRFEVSPPERANGPAKYIFRGQVSNWEKNAWYRDGDGTIVRNFPTAKKLEDWLVKQYLKDVEEQG